MPVTSADAILLFGGNSGIGNALARGLMQKLDCNTLIRVVRTDLNSAPQGDLVIKVEKYSDFNFELVKDKFNLSAIVIAFGILDESKSIGRSMEMNLGFISLESIKTLENVVTAEIINPRTEIHYTSSVLADYTRNSVYIYTLSKSITEKAILKYIKPIHPNLFIWKYAYVQTNLNKDRSPSVIRSTLEEVYTLAIRTKKPGMHYVPRFARIPSSLLRVVPLLHGFIK